jgi:hypothetical protein
MAYFFTENERRVICIIVTSKVNNKCDYLLYVSIINLFIIMKNVFKNYKVKFILFHYDRDILNQVFKNPGMLTFHVFFLY